MPLVDAPADQALEEADRTVDLARRVAPPHDAQRCIHELLSDLILRGQPRVGIELRPVPRMEAVVVAMLIASRFLESSDPSSDRDPCSDRGLAGSRTQPMLGEAPGGWQSAAVADADHQVREDFRPLSDREREILELLLSVELPGIEELREQVAFARAARWDCGCASFDVIVDRERAPRRQSRRPQLWKRTRRNATT